jgi:dTMP kinase
MKMNQSRHGHLIVLEGPDGIGKTTLSRLLVESWQRAGVPAIYYAFPGKEAGTLGDLIYRLHHDDPALGVHSINSVSRQVLHIAAHIDAIDRVISPALEEGKWVILDRFWWSTWVYGMADGIPEVVLQAMIDLEKAYWGDRQPTISFLVTRDQPLRIETSPERWALLVNFYAQLCERERSNYPVAYVSNQESVEGTLNTLRNITEKIIADIRVVSA